MKKFGIVTAMDDEANHIIHLYNLKMIYQMHTIKFYGNGNIVLALTGVGKIQASIGTSILFNEYKVDKIINIGIAGNLKGKNANIGDVFLINKIYQHDMYLPFDGKHLSYAKGVIEIPEYKLDISDNHPFGFKLGGICVTGDVFVDSIEKSTELFNKYGADVAEMEAFAVASTAREYGKLKNLYIVKAISDGADSDAINAHASNLDIAMDNSIEVLKSIIK